MDFAEAVHMKGFGWADYEIARDAMAVVILKSQRPGSRGIFRVLSKGAKLLSGLLAPAQIAP